MTAAPGPVLTTADGPSGAAVVTLCAPRANALGVELVDALTTAFAAAAQWCRSIVVRSSGRAFCSGFELSDLDTIDDTELGARFVSIQQLLDAVCALPVPTIAVVEGAAVGAGADLAVACDFRLGSPAARFRFPGIRFGLLLGTERLCQVVGARAACDLVLRQAQVDARSAYEQGLLTALVPGDELGEETDRLLAQLGVLSSAAVTDFLTVARARAHPAGPWQPVELVRRSIAEPGLADRMRRYVASAR